MTKSKTKQLLIVRRVTGRRKSRVRVRARVPLLFALIALVAAGLAECLEHGDSPVQAPPRAEHPSH